MVGVQILWPVSWYLATIAVLGMILLIGGRFLRDRSTQRHDTAATAILDVYMRLMYGEAAAVDELAPYRKQPRLLAECLLKVLDLVRGADRARMLEKLSDFGLVDLFLANLNRGSAPARLTMIEALGAFDRAEVRDALGRSVRDADDINLRLMAAAALIRLGADVDVTELIANIEARREAWSGSLAQVLRLIAEREPARCEQILGRTDLPVAARVLAAEALGGVGDYSVIPALIAAAQDQNRILRAAATSALGVLMHPAALPAIRDGLKDEDWRVRSAAARAAGEAGFSELTEGLIPLLSDQVWSVRFQAAEALAKFGPEGVSRLRQIADGRSDAAARAASLTLAERELA
jgi:HEAT repeat protein